VPRPKLGSRKLVEVTVSPPKTLSSGASGTNAKKIYCAWTAYAVQLAGVTPVTIVEEAKKANDAIYVRSAGGFGQNHWKFVVTSGSSVKAFHAPMGNATVRDVLRFAKEKIPGAQRVTSPRGRTYWISAGSSSGGGNSSSQ